MKKIAFLFLLAILFANCDKDKVVTVNGIVQGYVFDLNTNQFLANAVVAYGVGSDTNTVTSNSNGYFYIEGLPVGYTALTITKAGYATTHEYVYIDEVYDETIKQKDGGSVNYTTFAYVMMPALDAGLSGVIKIKVGTNNIIRPAAGFDLSLYVGENYIPSVYTTTTNSLGVYSFSNVPAGEDNAVLIVMPASDEDNYYSATSNVTLVPGANVELDVTVNGVNTKGIYLVSTNLEISNGVYDLEFPVDEEITLTFNQAVSEDNTLLYGYVLGLPFVDLEDDVDFTGNTVTITPTSDLANNATYTLIFGIQSNTPGDMATGSIQFRTEN